MKYIVTSDVHLGHLKTPTEHIISSFKSQILNNSNKDVNIIFIAGDLFDRPLDLNSKEVHLIIPFFSYFLNYCYKNNILLRVLEGTPSHDWQQPSLILRLNEIGENRVNLKYFKSLDIEYIEEYNKYILYIPDEWVNNHNELEKQIQAKFNTLNIDKVDIAVLHGMFKYQTLGTGYKGFYFKEDYFLNIVKGYIHVGHIHTFSTYDRIIANGSLERLAHGEEEPKGYIRVDGNNYTFVENKNSYVYKTIYVKDKTTLEELDRIILSNPKGSHIRLIVPKDSYYNVNFEVLKIRYMQYRIKKVIREHMTEKASITYLLNDTKLDFDVNNNIIDSDILEVLKNIISEKYIDRLSKKKIDKINNYLNNFSAFLKRYLDEGEK